MKKKALLGVAVVLAVLFTGCSGAGAAAAPAATETAAAATTGATKVVTDTTFANPDTAWTTWAADGTEIDPKFISASEVEIAVKGGGSANWEAQFKTPDETLFPVVRGKTYTVSFSAKSVPNRTMEIDVEEPTESTGYFKNFQKLDIPLTADYQKFTYTFKAVETYDSHLIFCLGAQGDSTVSIKDILVTSN
jgi:hypothetical protein